MWIPGGYLSMWKTYRIVSIKCPRGIEFFQSSLKLYYMSINVWADITVHRTVHLWLWEVPVPWCPLPMVLVTSSKKSTHCICYSWTFAHGLGRVNVLINSANGLQIREQSSFLNVLSGLAFWALAELLIAHLKSSSLNLTGVSDPYIAHL